MNTGYLVITPHALTHSVHCSNSRFTYAATSYDYTSHTTVIATSRALFTPYSTSWSRFIVFVAPASIAYASRRTSSVTAPNCDFAQKSERSYSHLQRTFFSRWPLVMCSYV